MSTIKGPVLPLWPSPTKKDMDPMHRLCDKVPPLLQGESLTEAPAEKMRTLFTEDLALPPWKQTAFLQADQSCSQNSRHSSQRVTHTN